MTYLLIPNTMREQWLPETINGAILPPTLTTPVGAATHPLTLTAGAAKKTTCNGFAGNGAATSNINCGAIHNGAAKLAIRMRLKLPVNFIAGSPTQYLVGKFVGANDSLSLFLQGVDGKIHLMHRSGGVTLFDISVGTGTLTAGTWYDIYAAIGQTIVGGAASNGARLRLNNGVAATNADVTALPAGGTVYLADFRNIPGDQLVGIISDVFIRASDVTAVQETDAFNGIPFPAANNIWWLDEGRGVTAVDRGTGGNNGTLGQATWAFSQVRQPALSFNGVSDYAISGAVVNIQQPCSFIWAGKLKSTYKGMSASHYFWQLQIDANNSISLRYRFVNDAIRFEWNVGGITIATDFTGQLPAIDDYGIFICTLSNNFGKLYYQGTLAASIANTTVMPGVLAVATLGTNNGISALDPSKPLFAGLVDGELTADQVLEVSRYLKNIYNLPISV